VVDFRSYWMQKAKKVITVLTRFLPILAFVAPFAILYSLYAYSFEQTYHGRTLYLFFLWLVLLEAILNWEKLQRKKVPRLRSLRSVLLVVALLLPTAYVVAANYCGLNAAIADSARTYIPAEDPMRDHHASLTALSVEYLVFAVLFYLVVALEYGTGSLMDFSLPASFLGIIGALFLVDNLYPGARFTPLQLPVPATATLAARVMGLMGYETIYSTINSAAYGMMPVLTVKNYPWASFAIAWPCSGIESLLIYSITLLLFLKNTDIRWWQRAVYFAIGALVTYLINILRIVTLFMIAIQKGPSFTISDFDFQRFHNYYGMLYSITWIMLYPLIIIGSRILWTRIQNWRTAKTPTPDQLQPSQPNPA
jgi:exosortase/archaeosortase family protein